jgi:TolB-like protein/DNA-binding winged helix-turn-helix (wHTH) protein/Tfp pilus assembly protein PilF
MGIASPSKLGAVRFGVFEVDLDSGDLRKQGIRVKLQEQPFQLLQVLLQRPGQVVTREELRQCIWPADTFVDFDSGLNNAVKRLREALGDSADRPSYIETIPKRGYRFIARVNGAHGAATFPRLETAKGQQPNGSRRGLRTAIGIGASIAILISILALAPADLWRRSAKQDIPQIRSIAVLPLQNLSGDSSQEYFSDGMTEELITELSRISGMKVVSRTSVMRYKNTNKSLPEIARALGVDGIVEGSVLRSGDRVRITAQLIYARTDANVWAETYDRDSQDIFALQEAVASAIAGKVKATMIPSAAAQERTEHGINLKAHEAYLLGVHEDDIGGTLANQKGMQQAATEHLGRAVAHYKQAILEDPGYARAYLALAFEDSTPEQREEEEIYARKALALDDNLSDAHLLIGAIKLVRDRNWADAEREILRAIELNPSSSTAHHGYAYLLDAEGRLDEGMKEWERAQELDPGNDHLAAAFYSRRQFDRLVDLERNELARNTEQNAYTSAVAHKTLMVCFARQNRRRESIEEFRMGLMAYGYDALADDLGRGYARGGYEAALREFLKGVHREKTEFPFPFLVTYAYVELGEVDAALASFSKLEMGSGWEAVAWHKANVIPTLVTLRIEPMWDPLRSDPKFEQSISKVSFPH